MAKLIFLTAVLLAATVNSTIDFDSIETLEPPTTLAPQDFGASSLMFLNVTIFDIKYTWNEALELCKGENSELLHIQSESDYIALEQVMEKHKDNGIGDIFWVGLHEPDPINKPNIWLWANCEPDTLTNWENTEYEDTTDDDRLCVVINGNSGFTLETRQCKDRTYVICMGEEGHTSKYSLEYKGLLEDGESLGPFELDQDNCEGMCSNTTYNGMECWVYAYNIDDTDVCLLYFALHSTFFDSQVVNNDSYAFRKKMVWSDTLKTGPPVTLDESIFPYSCCDVTHATSSCPVNAISSNDSVSPTGMKVNFILYTVPVTWNEAVIECETSGGALLQVNTALRYHLIIHLMDEWNLRSHNSSEVWIGLAQEYLLDPCSLRWTEDCATPGWTVFANQSYTDIDGKFCVALNAGEMNKLHCNETRKFICEIQGDPCSMEPDDSICPVQTGDILHSDSDDCDIDCLTTVHNGKECWTTVIYANRTCDLLFYTEPFICTSDDEYVPYVSVFDKNCFSATTRHSLLYFTVDRRSEPYRGCYEPFTYPHIPDEARCINTTPSYSAHSTSQYSLTSEGQNIVSSVSDSTSATESTSLSSSVASSSDVFISMSSAANDVTSTTVPMTLTGIFSETISSSPVATSIVSSTSTVFDVTSPVVFMTSAAITSEISPALPVTVSSDSSSSSTMPTTESAPTLASSTSRNVSYEPRPIYLSPCICRSRNVKPFVMEEWESWLNADLVVTLNNTTRYRRALTCAWDARATSAGIGVVAISVLVALGVYLLIMDVPIVRRNFKFIHAGRGSYRQYRRRKANPLRKETM